jgi:hypothetical protein
MDNHYVTYDLCCPCCSIQRNVSSAPSRWKSRLGHLSQYFHAYRIDHILGFCRIWEIPGDCATGTVEAALCSTTAAAGTALRKHPVNCSKVHDVLYLTVMSTANRQRLHFSTVSVQRWHTLSRSAADGWLLHEAHEQVNCRSSAQPLGLLCLNSCHCVVTCLFCGAGMLGYFRPSIPITVKDLEARGMTGADTLERLTGERGCSC